jgi:hypothetical protein
MSRGNADGPHAVVGDFSEVVEKHKCSDKYCKEFRDYRSSESQGCCLGKRIVFDLMQHERISKQELKRVSHNIY